MAQPPRPAATSIPKATSTKKVVVAEDKSLFGKTNILLMIVGGVIILLGMLLMAGGRSSDPKVFDYNEVYSKMRITVAPILIIIGILVEVVAIFKQGKPAVATAETTTL